MTVPPDKLPPKSRDHLLRARGANDWSVAFRESLRFLYDTTIYLASIALSDYRSHATIPDLDVESRVSRPRSNLREYIELFWSAVVATDRTLCELSHPSQMRFTTSPRLRAAMAAAERLRGADGSRLEGLYKQECATAPAEHDVMEFFRTIQDMRNRGHGHLEQSGFDAFKDFYKIASGLLQEAAEELLAHPEVDRVLDAWYQAEVVDIRSDGMYVRRFGEPVQAVLAKASCAGIEQGDDVLVRECEDGPEVRGPFISLLDGDGPSALADEALAGAIDARNYKAAVEATRRDFASQHKKPIVSPMTIDDLLVMVLEDFKLTAAPLDVDTLVGKLDRLLDRHSEQLPARIVRDIDYFVWLTQHARSYQIYDALQRKGNARERLVELAQSGSETERGQAIATLGTLCDADAAEPLMHIVEHEPRAALRKHALLALGRLGAAGAFDFLSDKASDHHRDPGAASYALRALSGRPTQKSVDFLAQYIAEDAPYACLNAAAWSLAEIFNDHPQLAESWIDKLIEHIRTLRDPYTRGCLMFALAMTRQQDLASRIVASVWPSDAPVDAYVLEDACLAAGLLGDPGCLPFLVACAQPDQPDPVVRRQAILGLRRLATPEALEAVFTLPPATEHFVRRAQQSPLPPSPVPTSRASTAADVG